MSSNSTKPVIPPLPLSSGTEFSSPFFSWKDCFSTTVEPLVKRGEQNHHPQLPVRPTASKSVVPKLEHTTTLLHVAGRGRSQATTPLLRVHSPLADISSVPSIFDPFQTLPDKDLSNIVDPHHRPTSSTHTSGSSDDSETSSSMSVSPPSPMGQPQISRSTSPHRSPSLSVDLEDVSPPPQKRMKKETPVQPRSMFRAPHTAYPPAIPSYNTDISQLPSLFPSALPCILPGENGEEQLSLHSSPRLSSRRRSFPQIKPQKPPPPAGSPPHRPIARPPPPPPPANDYAWLSKVRPPEPTSVKKEKKTSRRDSATVRNIIQGKRQSRKKTNVACTNCVRAKAGCDQGRPCSRCQRLGKPNCIDRPINTRRRRKVSVGRFVDGSSDRREEPIKAPPAEFIIGSYNGDADGYIDYYMARPIAHTTIPPLPLPPVPALNSMAPHVRNAIIYGQTTNWAAWNPICPPTSGSLYGAGLVRRDDLSPSLSPMDTSKSTQTTLALAENMLDDTNLKHEILRPSTTSPKPRPLYYY